MTDLSVPISFPLVGGSTPGPPLTELPLRTNLTLLSWNWHEELEDPNSDLYKAYANKICNQVSI